MLNNIQYYSDVAPDVCKETEGVAQSAHEELNWKSSRYVGSAYVRAESIHEPAPIWGARLRCDEHVQNLMHSFTNTGSVNEAVSVVCMDTNLYNMWRKGELITADGQVNMPALLDSKSGLCAFAGDHTREACVRLAEQYKNGALWHWIRIRIYLAPESQLDMRMLRVMGNRSNQLAGVHLKTSFASILIQNHTHAEAIKAHYYKDAKELDRQLGILRNDLARSLKIPKNSALQITGLAGHTGRKWELIKKLLTGDVEAHVGTRTAKGKFKPFKKPESCHNFTTMATIPDKVVCEMLQGVINGDRTLTQFRKDCEDFKARRKVKAHILEIVWAMDNNMPELEREPNQEKRWDIIHKECPALTSSKFISPWVPIILETGLTKPVPVSLTEAIRTMVDEFSRKKVFFVLFE